jgi:hypothetical protein
MYDLNHCMFQTQQGNVTGRASTWSTDMKKILIAAIASAATVIAAASPRHPSAPSLYMAPDSIASPAAPGSTTPNLATAPDGKIYMSWLEPAADSAMALRFAVYDGVQWSAARTIASSREFIVNWADFASIEVLGNRQVAAHWLQRGRARGSYGVRVAQSHDDGATWSAALVPHRDSTSTEHGFVGMWKEPARPTLRPVTSNSIGAVWLDGRGFERGAAATNEMMLMATSLSADGQLSQETVLDRRVCDCCQTSAAITSAGPIIAYRDRSPDEIRDISVIRRVDGKWTAPQPVSRDGWKIDACPVNGPAIDAAGARVALAWFTGARDTAHVKIAFSTNSGATFGAPVIIDSGNPAGRVDVKMLTDGSALVTWIERTGGSAAEVRVRHVTAAGRAGKPITVATSSAGNASGFPRMSIARDYALFAWTVPGRPSAVRVARAPIAGLR